MQNTRKSIVQQTAVVVLAAGKGTRMGRDDCAKVCFEIDGVPAINRTVRTFKKLRFNKFVIVVGALAEQVMETLLNSPKYNITIDGKAYTSHQIESHCKGVNPSL